MKQPSPTPPTVPSVPITCPEIHTFDKQIARYEFYQNFMGPYYEIVDVILDAMQAVKVLDPNNFDCREGLGICTQICEKAQRVLWELGDTYKKSEPPDQLYYLLQVLVPLNKKICLFSGEYIDPHILDWHQGLFNYYYKQLKDKHEYRSFPLIIQLAKLIVWFGGSDFLDKIVDAMTFEVVVSTNFSAIWYTGEESSIKGNVIQKADVKNIKLNFFEEGRGWLWGEAENMLLKSESGTFTNSKGVVDLKGQQIPCSVWLINWDPCIQSTFDVMLGGFHLGHNESSTISGPASDRSFEDYWYVKAGLFSFEIPMTNYSEVLGEKTFSGTGSVDDVFSSAGKITIKIIHTPQ